MLKLYLAEIEFTRNGEVLFRRESFCRKLVINEFMGYISQFIWDDSGISINEYKIFKRLFSHMASDQDFRHTVPLKDTPLTIEYGSFRVVMREKDPKEV